MQERHSRSSSDTEGVAGRIADVFVVPAVLQQGMLLMLTHIPPHTPKWLSFITGCGSGEGSCARTELARESSALLAFVPFPYNSQSVVSFSVRVTMARVAV